jgi:tetratricopeptide (TPR) repeat protein
MPGFSDSGDTPMHRDATHLFFLAASFSLASASRLGRAAVALLVLAGVACAGSVESRLAEIQALHDSAQFEASIDPLREILAEHPDHGEANQLLGVALIQTGQPSLAIWPLEKASRDPEYTVSAGMLLASTAITLRGYEDAIRAVDRVLEVDPERETAVLLRAQALLAAGRHEESLASIEKLVALSDGSYTALLMQGTVLAELSRMDEARAIHESLRDSLPAEDPQAPAACMAVANFHASTLGDKEEGLKRYRGCIDDYPNHPSVVALASRYLDSIGEREEANELFKSAMEAAPEDQNLYQRYAQRLAQQGETDRAAEMYEQMEETFGTSQGWLELSNLLRSQEKYAEAGEALDRAFEGKEDRISDEMKAMRAELYVDAERLDEARALAAELKEPIYRQLIEGRIAIADEDPARALEALEAALANWPNNAGARFLAGVAARDLGRYEDAGAHLREAVRADAEATDAAVTLADLYHQQGSNAEAFRLARLQLVRRPGQREAATLIAARAAVALAKYAEAQEAIDAYEKAGGSAATAAVERARIVRAEKGLAESIAVLRGAGLDLADPESEPLLRELSNDLAESEDAATALQLIDAAIARSPEDARLHELQGAVLIRAGDDAGATASFERALEIDPDQGRALAGLAILAQRAGDLEGALALLDRASEASPKNAEFPYQASQIALGLGRVPEARTRLDEAVLRSAGHAGARNNLAWLLAEAGEVDRALRLALEARRIERSPEILDTLGWVHLKRGEGSQAVDVFEQALELRAGDPLLLYHLALAQKANGDEARAIETLEQALGAGTFAEEQAARQELAALQQEG